jgi:lipopolysaccharide transport system ATP-binding protein
MSDVVIKVENLSKKYTIRRLNGRDDSLRHAIHNLAIAPFRWVAEQGAKRSGNGRGNTHQGATGTLEEFHALKDVSFEVNRGEVVGIIGRNGAGKSTLLKILSRITEPTNGRVRIKGRVASLLEVGTGFHPELTGRENIFLNGGILGMKRQEIKRKFDEIVTFAEIDKFLDTPVKRYSSGMYVRLAFAVAAHLDPEILLIDEVLAVGDADFQRKCLGKMGRVAKEGRTVLFISHSMGSIGTLTERCVLLDSGQVILDGDTQSVIHQYLSAKRTAPFYSAVRDTSPYIKKISVKTKHGGETHVSGDPMTIEIHVNFGEPVTDMCLALQIVNQFGLPVIHCAQYDGPCRFGERAGTFVLTCRIPSLRLNVGMHSITCHLAKPPGGPAFDRVFDVCHFSVVIVNKTTLFGWRADACAYLEDFTFSAEYRAE